MKKKIIFGLLVLAVTVGLGLTGCIITKAATLPEEYYGTYITTEMEAGGVKVSDSDLKEALADRERNFTFIIDKEYVTLNSGNKELLKDFVVTKKADGYTASFGSTANGLVSKLTMNFAKKDGKHTITAETDVSREDGTNIANIKSVMEKK